MAEGQCDANRPVTERQLQQIIVTTIEGEGGMVEHPPIVASGQNSIIPHHAPGEVLIRPDTLVLIDAWCKKNCPNAPYADLTQVAFTGKQPPEIVQKIFHVVREAQETAIRFMTPAFRMAA